MRFPAKSGLLLVVAAAVLASFGGVCLAEEKAMTPLGGGIPMIEGIKMLDVGAPAPDFTLKDTKGEVFHLAELKGKKPVVIVFWSIFCEPCRFEMPVIQKLADKYKAGGLEVISVVLDGEPLKSSIDGFIKQENYTIRTLIDELDAKEMFKVADPYGVGGTPTIYIIDRSGVVSMARSGRIKEEELEKAILSVTKK
ncbi:MAG TPA: TlpA disulfide reductase family protein [Candidatus Deferrimicrobiaceae bacterium]|jgi:peroxiredoxin